MDIRDVKISQSGKLVRHWELKQHNGNTCYDIVNNVPAYAQNPYWLIDNYIEWKNIYSYSGKGKTSIAFNSRDAVFYLLTGNNLSVLDPAKNTTLSLDTIKKGYPAMLPSPHLAYDTLTNNLISYDLNGGVVSTFSFDNLSWSLKEKRVNDPFYNNHAFAFSATDTSIYTFGGYGFYRFKNDLFKIKLNSGAIEKLDKIAQIFPRYSSASAVVGNTLYVFGGRGNKSGKQEFLISNFYDLYAIDLQSMHSHKLWDVKENMLEQDFILAPGMYYEPSDSSFYVASIEKGGILMKIFPNDSKWKYVSKPIGNYVSYKEMDFDLYYAPNQNKMFVVFNKTLSDLSYNLSIYSINLPLVEESAISQPIENKGFNGILIAVLIVVPFIIFLFYYHWRKSNRKKTDASARELPKKDKSFNLKPEQGVETSYFDRTKSAISFLGSFNVQDKRGKDITLSFTPRLKDLLILVLLNSAHHKQGILIKKLDNIIWEDKDKIAARNNRNVSLRKLRMLLDSIGNINIISDNGFLRIDLGEDIFCDYCTALEYIEKVKQNKENDGETLLKLIELLLYGSLLPNTIIEWLDNYKNNYSSLSIDLLNNLLQLEMEKQNTDLVLKIADTIFIHDPLSEEALFAKCIILYKSGKKGLAKNIYENYRKEHETLLNTPYKTPFSKIVGNDENS
jgi:DNA-binding SARP family transcriptional activator